MNYTLVNYKKTMLGKNTKHRFLLTIIFLFFYGTTLTFLCYLGEEIITLVIDKDECREVFYFDFPN